MADIKLVLTTVPVTFLKKRPGVARAEGNNASWICACGNELPLVGRCYFQFGHKCHTICPDCDRRYRVIGDVKKKAQRVEEF
jgi:hypothetical protein